MASRVDHFGLIAPFYERMFGGAPSPRLQELLALPAGSLLDVGGGTGRIADYLTGQVGQVVVADPSRGMLSQARTRPCLQAVRGHAERLPFRDGAFERVLVVDALHHFADHRRAAAELVRVVAPGGRLVVQDMNLERGPVKMVALGERLLLMQSHFYGPLAIQALFEGTGGRVTVEVHGSMDLFVVVEKPAEPGAAMPGRSPGALSHDSAGR